jgi:DNA-binding Lrp family transcriptional regulator
MMWARDLRAPNATAKALLLLLGELADDTGRVYRDQAYIGKILQLSRETVGRNMAKLEESGFVEREHRYTDTSRRLADITRLNLHVTQDHIGPEPYVTENEKPGDAGSHSDVTQDHDKEKTTTTKQKRNTNGAQASPDAAPAPEQIIAKTLYDETRGALPFMGMRTIAKWAIEAWPDLPWQQIGKSMRDLHENNRGVSKSNLRLVLDGIAVPGRPQYSRPDPTEKFNKGIALAQQYAAQEAAQERMQIEA